MNTIPKTAHNPILALGLATPLAPSVVMLVERTRTRNQIRIG